MGNGWIRGLLLVSVAACPGAEPAQTWYLGCGDPACSGYSGPTDGVPLCANEGVTVGDACTDEGAQCDPEDDCNALVVCASEDPQAGGCPISLRKAKRAIHYVGAEDRASAAEQLLAMRLATWQYTWEPADVRPHLGFVIDDLPAGTPAVAPDGAHVDLYGYTSLAVAAIQSQQAQIDALRAELDLLRATCPP